MRKINGVLSLIIIILFLVHGVTGSLQLIGSLAGGIRALHILDRALILLIALHGIIGIKLTIDTISAQRKAGTSYYSYNKRFWAVRISGAAIFILIFFHVFLFIGQPGEHFRLNYFGTVQLILQILLVLSIAIHVVLNVRPQLISFGIKGLRNYVFDIAIILSGILVFCGLAFLIYYGRWAAI